MTAVLANASNSQKQVVTRWQLAHRQFVESLVTSETQDPVHTMAVLKPFMMLASVAFVAGFAGYLAVVRINTLTPPDTAWQAPISTVSSADGWNIGKQI